MVVEISNVVSWVVLQVVSDVLEECISCIFYSEDVSNTFLQNAGNHMQHHAPKNNMPLLARLNYFPLVSKRTFFEELV